MGPSAERARENRVELGNALGRLEDLGELSDDSSNPREIEGIAVEDREALDVGEVAAPPGDRLEDDQILGGGDREEDAAEVQALRVRQRLPLERQPRQA